jgi:hypothetical protein
VNNDNPPTPTHPNAAAEPDDYDTLNFDDDQENEDEHVLNENEAEHVMTEFEKEPATDSSSETFDLFITEDLPNLQIRDTLQASSALSKFLNSSTKVIRRFKTTLPPTHPSFSIAEYQLSILEQVIATANSIPKQQYNRLDITSIESYQFLITDLDQLIDETLPNPNHAPPPTPLHSPTYPPPTPTSNHYPTPTPTPWHYDNVTDPKTFIFHLNRKPFDAYSNSDTRTLTDINALSYDDKFVTAEMTSLAVRLLNMQQGGNPTSTYETTARLLGLLTTGLLAGDLCYYALDSYSSAFNLDSTISGTTSSVLASRSLRPTPDEIPSSSSTQALNHAALTSLVRQLPSLLQVSQVGLNLTVALPLLLHQRLASRQVFQRRLYSVLKSALLSNQLSTTTKTLLHDYRSEFFAHNTVHAAQGYDISDDIDHTLYLHHALFLGLSCGTNLFSKLRVLLHDNLNADYGFKILNFCNSRIPKSNETIIAWRDRLHLQCVEFGTLSTIMGLAPELLGLACLPDTNIPVFSTTSCADLFAWAHLVAHLGNQPPYDSVTRFIENAHKQTPFNLQLDPSHTASEHMSNLCSMLAVQDPNAKPQIGAPAASVITSTAMFSQTLQHHHTSQPKTRKNQFNDSNKFSKPISDHAKQYRAGYLKFRSDIVDSCPANTEKRHFNLDSTISKAISLINEHETVFANTSIPITFAPGVTMTSIRTKSFSSTTQGRINAILYLVGRYAHHMRDVNLYFLNLMLYATLSPKPSLLPNALSSISNDMQSLMPVKCQATPSANVSTIILPPILYPVQTLPIPIMNTN